jgi:hypothetical protein
MDLPVGGMETAQRLVDECKAREADQVACIAELKRNRCSTAEAQVLRATLENRLIALQKTWHATRHAPPASARSVCSRSRPPAAARAREPAPGVFSGPPS